MDEHVRTSYAKEEWMSPPLQSLEEAQSSSVAVMENSRPSKANSKTDKEPKKRKKAARACNHCQTAHLTCDDSRPCERCVKRNLGDTCQDGARKKAKYLRDIEDDLVNAGKINPTPFLTPKATESVPPLRPEASPPRSGTLSTYSLQPTQSPVQSTLQPLPPEDTGHGAFNTADPTSAAALNRAIEALTSSTSNGANGMQNTNTLHTNNTLGSFDFLGDFNLGNDFGSNSTNLEYAVLSSMLQNAGYGSTTPATYNTSLPDLNNNMADTRLNMAGNSIFPSLHSMYSNDAIGSNSQIGQHGNTSVGSQSFPSQAQNRYGGQSAFALPTNGYEASTSAASTSHAGIGGSSSNAMQQQQQQQQQQSRPYQAEARYSDVKSFSDSPAQSTSHESSASGQAILPQQSDYTQSLSPLSNPNGSSFSGQSRSFSSALDWNNSKPSAGLAAPSPKTQHANLYRLPRRQGSGHPLDSQRSPGTSNSNHKTGQEQQPPSTSHSTKPITSSSGVMRVEDVYKLVNKPYNYLEAYHALIRHLQNNFQNRAYVLRIIRALSIYRPSLIALQMPLTTDDEIFIERSFQRTLIELEKLISFSGTPTIVFRRTGEIVLVGTEFTMLSEWRRDELLCRESETSQADANAEKKRKPKRRYIFEIFDQESCVEYYESFAAHAFESSSSTIMHTCNLVTPKGRKVPCTFAYTLKRDIFGLPSMVIGQFLPILTLAA